MIIHEIPVINSLSDFKKIILGLFLANTVTVITVAIKFIKNVSKAKKLIHRQNWRVNILWQERLESKNLKEDPIEKELFGEHFN